MGNALIGLSKESGEMHVSRSWGKVSCSWAVVAVTALWAQQVSWATPLNTGDLLYPSPGGAGPAGGAVIAGGVPIPFAAPTYSGTLTSTVIAGDVSNPYGGLTFTYLLTSDLASSHVIERLTLNDFAGFLVDASYQTPAAGVVPGFIDRQVSDVEGFRFFRAPLGKGAITAGGTSALLVLQTNAPSYTSSIASVIDGTVATVPTYAPTPEPATVVLLALGFLIRRPR